MALEITASGALNYLDANNTQATLFLNGFQDSVTNKLIERVTMQILTTDTPLKLGSITSLGWFFGINRDPTNYLELRVGALGTKCAYLPPLGFACFRWGSGVTAPSAIANTAACALDYLLVST